MSRTPYDEAFYARQASGSRSSAERVVPTLLAWLAPTSVVDVGCGVGTWLGEWARRGVTDVTGVDGPHVDVARLEIPPARFVARDLAAPLALGRSFDLVMSLEVAEHLPASRADAFVAELVALGPVVAFSAAIPGQGGSGHVNEEWPEAWARRFERHGYRWADALRARVWADPLVEPWYAQNLLLYHRDGAFPSPPWGPELGPSAERPWPLSLVHPRVYARRALGGRHPVRHAWRELRRAIRTSVFGPRRT